MSTSNIRISGYLAMVLLFNSIQLSAAQHQLHGLDAVNSIQVSNRINLPDIIDIASQRAPETGQEATLGNYAAALHKRSRRLLAESPSIGLDHQFDNLTDDNGFRETEIGIELPLWRPKQKRTYKELAQSTAEQASDYPARVRLIAAGRIRESVWELKEFRANLMLAEQTYQSAQTLETKIRRLVEMGEQAKTDLLLATQNRLSAQQAVTDAQASLHEAELHYYHLTGLQQVPEVILEAVGSGELTETHPALASSLQQLNQARAKARLARSTGNGQPTLRINTRNEAGLDGAEDQDSIGIGISLPLGGRKYAAANTAAAEQDAASAETDYKLLRHELADTLTRARVEYKSIQEVSRMVEEKLALAEQQLKLSTRAYEVGEMDFIDLLRIQSAFFEAQKDNIQIQTRLGRTIATINQALGITP